MFAPINLASQHSQHYFLALVIFQLFPVFGAASASTTALPILFILIVTAIKDGVEDHRRAKLDAQVNTSAVTRLGQWQNINQPLDPRPWYQLLLSIKAPGKLTKGVQKLREKEAGEGMRIVLSKGGEGDRVSMSTMATRHRFPYAHSRLTPAEVGSWGQTKSFSAYQQSIPSRSSLGVIDWKRRTSGTAQWERTPWKKLEVGDVVLLRENEQVPADVVILSTSGPDGICYLETKNLDGETNLKPRKALNATSSIASEEDLEKSSFILESEPPHQNLYLYSGVLRYTDPANGDSRKEGITINKLLRGCTVWNTAWIIGLVVFTGPDTKIYLNGGITPSKQSKIAKEINFNVIVNFLFLLIICALCSHLWYPTSSSVLNALVTFVSCLIAFQNIVPVSLFISIEIVKTIQAYFIAQDVDMYYKPFDTACVPKNWGISDDLGQIEYVFQTRPARSRKTSWSFKCAPSTGWCMGKASPRRSAAPRRAKGAQTQSNPRSLHVSSPSSKTRW
ncbi:hypothetical protein OG21DRAFT_1488765 [Imleria badia]|nr:hypothetical protein OG21DRAFT_1488765 [Imleria badia]